MNTILVLDANTVLPIDDSRWNELKGEDRSLILLSSPVNFREARKHYPDTEILLTNKVPVNAEMMDAMPRLRCICVMATGTNIVDIAAATARGIAVCNVPAYSTHSVAQRAIALLLAITNRVEYYTDRNRSGAWERNANFSYHHFPITELAGKKMGIIGYGAIGRATAAIASALGMEILAYTSKPQSALPDGVTRMDLDDVFRHADVVSLHCPLAPDTARMVNARRLKLMKPSGILINTARGGLVDETALANALDRGIIRAAGLDVLDREPPRPDCRLLRCPNCYITPHIGWASEEALARLFRTTVDNVLAAIQGNPQNRVN